jgi:hypothetical protein
MLSRNSNFFQFCFIRCYLRYHSFSGRLISIGIPEGLVVVPVIDIVIITLGRMFKKHGRVTLKILFN